MTLRHVAQRAGVSTATISKVLNGRPDVAPETRQRVLHTLEEEGYERRGAAMLPTAGEHIELVFDALENPNNLVLTRGVVEAARERSARVATSTLPADVSPTRWVDDLQRLGRAGVILVTARIPSGLRRRLDGASLPFVLIDPLNPVEPPVVSIGVGNWQAGYGAVLHLLELGHRRIAMLRGYECLVDDARYHGYLAALARFHVSVDPAIVVRAGFRYATAVEVGHDLLARPGRPTAVFGGNDLAAVGTIHAARRLGLRVPEDLSVVGFDDSVVAIASWPPLTTVRQPFEEMGRVAYHLLTDLMEGRQVASARVELGATLIVRESTGPVPTQST